MSWWRDGVLYQIYVRSFADSNGDGVGDLGGVITHLDYLEALGVDGIWLSPIHPSPNEDWGYEVADYRGVAPELGTLADLDRLIAEAERRRIRVLLDLVPNHTSDRHPWFVDSRSSRTSRRRGWYVWADAKPDGSLPNNWVSPFGGPAWKWDGATGQFYLHHFLESQPDLDWWNEEVRREFDETLRFWFDRGVAGFRIDVCHMIVKDRELRDNPPARDDDHPSVRLLGQRQLWDANLPGAHEVLRRWRRIASRYDPPRLLLGETYVFDLAEIAKYVATGDELDLAFDFRFTLAPFELDGLRAIVESTERAYSTPAWPVWTASNHDSGRFATRWCAGDERKIRAALLMLLTLRGTPVLYFGDEIGLPEGDVPYERLRDPVGKRFWPSSRGRDGGRTPMLWARRSGLGFTRDDVEPWLPFGDARTTVEEQERDPRSVLAFARELIRYRRGSPDLRSGSYSSLVGPPGVWAWRRGERTIVAINGSDESVTISELTGTIRVATSGRARESLSGTLTLAPWEGVVIGA